METTRIQSNTTETVYFMLLDASGNAVTGLAGAQLNMLTLMRKSDGGYWSGVTWGEGSTSLAVVEQSATYSPGVYYYTSPSLAEDEYVVTVDSSDADNVPQIGQIKVGSYVDNIDSTISDKATSASISALNNLSSQNVRDAMKLAPTAGTPAAGSVDKHLDDAALETSVAVVSGIVTDVQDIVKNKMTIDKVTSKLKLWNDAGTVVLYEWPLTDIDGAAISIGAGAPSNRGVPA